MAIGSVVGAVALHVAMVAMVACGGGAQPTGDGGVLDALADAARDVLDAETRDAHAGGDGGVPACNCVEPPSFSFSGGALTRDGQPPQEPAASGMPVESAVAGPKSVPSGLRATVAAVTEFAPVLLMAMHQLRAPSMGRSMGVATPAARVTVRVKRKRNAGM